jgi:uncharacterized membrane protein YgdD (TMEM256/DUF423 family)
MVTNCKLFHTVPIMLASSHGGMHTGGWLLAGGVTLFSGAVYGIILQPKWRILGLVTPIGGLLLIAGWIHLALNPK